MTKVVEFPKSKIVRELPPNLPEIEKAKEKSLLNFADSIVDDITTSIFEEFENYGLNTDTDKFAKDFSFSTDALRATVYRLLDIKHHLHEFIDTNIEVKKMSEIRKTLEEDDDMEIELYLEDDEPLDKE